MEPRRMLPSDIALVKQASIDIFQDDPTVKFFEDAPGATPGAWLTTFRETYGESIEHAANNGSGWMIGDADSILVYWKPEFAHIASANFEAWLDVVDNSTNMTEEQKKRNTDFRKQCGEAIHKALDEREWYFVHLLGTQADHRKRGHATTLLNKLYEEMDARGASAWLFSSNINNEAFYSARGFTSKAEIILGENDPVWNKPPVVVQISTREPKKSV